MMQLAPALRKAAILIHSLDARSADALLDQMSDEDARRVRDAIMELGDIDAEEQEQIIADFVGRQSNGAANSAEDGVELAVSSELLAASNPVTVPHKSAEKPFAFLQQAPVEIVAKHLLREHPQTIAVVLAHLAPPRSAAIVMQFPAALRTDVLLRVGDMSDMDSETVQELERGLENALSRELKTVRSSGAGAATLQAILSAAGPDRDTLVKGMAAQDSDMAARFDESPVPKPLPHVRHSGSTIQSAEQSMPNLLTKKMPTSMKVVAPSATLTVPALEFAQLTQLDDRAWAKVLRAVDSQVALLALAGASPELVTRLLRQLAPRDAKLFQRRMEQIGPVRLREIEQAQQQVARAASQLAARGEIRIPRQRPFATAA